jgi:hypothetical protein
LKTYDGGVRVRNRISGALALVITVLGVAAFAAAAYFHSREGLIAASYSIWLLLLVLAHHLSWISTKTRPARIEASQGFVSIDGRRRRISRAKIVPQPAGRATVVQIGRRFDPYGARVELGTFDEARDFVRALGLDAREGVTRFRGPLNEPLIYAFTVFALVLGVVAFALVGVPGPPLALAATIAIERVTIPRITIGADGILIERFLRKRFLPYANIVSLEREAHQNLQGQPMVSLGFWVRLDTGEKILVDTTRERLRDYMFQGDHLFDVAKAAHELALTKEVRPADLLVRGGRSTKEWLHDLDGTRDAHYRVAALTDEDLGGVLRDPNADKTARVGAAICLARAGEEARGRVRVAVEDIAQPDVRAAALAALEDDENALSAALEALE